MPVKRNILAFLGGKDWLIVILWFGLAFLGAITEISRGNYNNFLIFRNVFYHLVHQQPLYIEYPAEYFDVNLYGPVFSLMIAPFAVLPVKLGALLWAMAGAGAIFYAIRQLPLEKLQQNIILLLCSQELLGASGWFQLNQFILAGILLTFAFTIRGKDYLATLCIILGTLTKFYGIVGLAFFFFSSHPKRFIAGLFLWSVVLFLLPMAISTPAYIVQSYQEWFAALVHKNEINQADLRSFQDISAGGFIKRLFKVPQLNDLLVLVSGALLFALQYLRLKDRHHPNYRLYLLCSVLLFPVLFSSSSESPTYIIAIPAICIWYVIQTPARWKNIFLFFSILLVSFSHSDLLTPWFRSHVAVPYAIKALPCLVLYVMLVYRILTRQFDARSENVEIKSQSALAPLMHS
ncbi:glycosyltransferase family 87 protein [Chitinophaga sp. CB10]|uniref:glycosyltransferase family 87 protein n=1 Tax=Chitinophaga sp. CB10 TaxID=1891659 RepID=UPI000AFAC2C8|nr:glycosyltransferase family 87 protein [Chitinophaga sp. CB10]